jgi:hypothetical protein
MVGNYQLLFSDITSVEKDFSKHVLMTNSQRGLSIIVGMLDVKPVQKERF